MAEPSNPTFVLASVICEDGRVQVVWTDPASQDAYGRRVEIDEILLGPDLAAEFAELTDAAHQLVTSWAALRRERAPR